MANPLRPGKSVSGNALVPGVPSVCPRMLDVAALRAVWAFLLAQVGLLCQISLLSARAAQASSSMTVDPLSLYATIQSSLPF